MGPDASLPPRNALAAVVLLRNGQRNIRQEAAGGQFMVKTISHFVEVTDIQKEAQQRLTEIRLDEQARLFSLRVNGRTRLWAIRDLAILCLLWWDPGHGVCPSLKKHT
jgi:hypothetical protein